MKLRGFFVGVDWSGLIANEGSNTWVVYVNDSLNQINLTSVCFFVDSCVPNMTNTSWSGWSNLSCSGDEMNQSPVD